MAISVQVPKDLSGIKTKVALNLTKILTPGIRPYRSENLYKQLEEKEKLRREVRYLEEKAKGRTGKPQKKQL